MRRSAKHLELSWPLPDPFPGTHVKWEGRITQQSFMLLQSLNRLHDALDQHNAIAGDDLQTPSRLIAHRAKVRAIEFGPFPYGTTWVIALCVNLSLDTAIRPGKLRCLAVDTQLKISIPVAVACCCGYRHQLSRRAG